MSKTEKSAFGGDKYQRCVLGSSKKLLIITLTRAVFAGFVDLTKAFDRVNYWKLFNQLISEGVDVYLVKLLAYWYVNQEVDIPIR